MSMDNCPRCNKLFNRMRSPICPECEKEEEADFQTVRHYIEENPASTLAEVVEETGVSNKRIQKFLRDGRLEVSKGLQGLLHCTSCGKEILSGKMCSNCALKVGNKIDDIFGKSRINPKKENKGPKMHTSK